MSVYPEYTYLFFRIVSPKMWLQKGSHVRDLPPLAHLWPNNKEINDFSMAPVGYDNHCGQPSLKQKALNLQRKDLARQAKLRNGRVVSKKSPTGPTDRTPKPGYLIALVTFLGVRW